MAGGVPGRVPILYRGRGRGRGRTGQSNTSSIGNGSNDRSANTRKPLHPSIYLWSVLRELTSTVTLTGMIASLYNSPEVSKIGTGWRVTACIALAFDVMFLLRYAWCCFIHRSDAGGHVVKKKLRDYTLDMFEDVLSDGLQVIVSVAFFVYTGDWFGVVVCVIGAIKITKHCIQLLVLWTGC